MDSNEIERMVRAHDKQIGAMTGVMADVAQSLQTIATISLAQVERVGTLIVTIDRMTVTMERIEAAQEKNEERMLEVSDKLDGLIGVVNGWIEGGRK